MKQGVYLNKLYIAALQLYRENDENPFIWAAAAAAAVAAAVAAAASAPAYTSKCLWE